MVNLKRARKKLQIICQVIRSDRVNFSAVLRPQEQIRGLIFDFFIAKFGMPENAKKEQTYHHYSDELFHALTDSAAQCVENKMKNLVQNIHRGAVWYFGMVSGMSTLWEFKVKILAARHHIEIKQQEKSRKQVNLGVMPYRDLGLIIEDFQKGPGRYLNLDLKRLADLRNSLVHGNFHQLRQYIALPRKKIRDEHKGNVFVMNTETGVTNNLSDDLDEVRREEQDIFGWFLEGASSSLLEDVFDDFEEGGRKINYLMEFRAMSFDELEEIYKKVVFEGKKLETEDIRKYEEKVGVSGLYKLDQIREIIGYLVAEVLKSKVQ